MNRTHRNRRLFLLLAGLLAAWTVGTNLHSSGSLPLGDTLIENGHDSAGLLGLLGGSSTGSLTQRYAWQIPRATNDRPDQKTLHQLHPIYLVPSDKTTQALDINGIIDVSVRSINYWMRQQSGLKWRLDTFSFTPKGYSQRVSAIDVTYVKSAKPASSLNTVTEVAAELQGRGFNHPRKRYLVWVASDGRGYCGEGEYIYSSGPDSYMRFTSVFLDGPATCRARSWAANPSSPSWTETIAAHEMLHNEGGVPPRAQHHCGSSMGHVCGSILGVLGLDAERGDVLYKFLVAPLSSLSLDRGRDDYFGHNQNYRDIIDSRFLKRV